ncbi:DUF397 domain-containing protein [Streptomyces sp. NWU339]|uniref:DUF397 domain-containing protein n=1 Tax=Streptomyces sp. NWU339 TaxID=2185284 RepID=UPI000D68411A|nr:DUF397 domain-containing protein [Streptomyces sp. NWU339]PWI06781.1 DUF397 domain-containing protein [Streptomyces sp. NWU339]
MTGTPPARTTTVPAWFKSSYSSSGDGNDCVEVAISPDNVLVRDSKNTRAPRLTLTPAAWADFLGMAGFASRG